MSFAVHDGRVQRDGKPFLVLGAVYYPSAAGCRMWTDWDLTAIREDFTRIAGSGLNTVRLFLFWRDFAPSEGYIDQDVVDRLTETVAAAEDSGLGCVLSLLTIWMNGQRLDLPWRRGRSIWRDPQLVGHAEQYVQTVAKAVRHLGNVVAYDLGDEIANVDPTHAAALSGAEVAAWHTRLAGAIRSVAPRAIVFQANDASAVFGTSAFGTDNCAALDLVGVHGFPTWAPGSIESTLAYKATMLVPFLVRFAAASGVPFVDELGSYGTDEQTAAAYLRTCAASAIAHGVSGLVVWFWQDVSSTEAPYRERPMERAVGLHRLDGSARPAMTEVRRLAEAAGDLAVGPVPAEILVHLGERVRSRGDSYLDARTGTLPVFYAGLLLTRAHLPFDLSPDIAGHHLVVCPSVEHLTLPDIDRLIAAARAGAVVYLSLGDHLHGFPGRDITGVEIVDFARGDTGKDELRWDGQSWPIDWSHNGGVSTTLRAVDAEVLACYPDGTPALVSRRLDAGRILFCNAPFERQIDSPGRLTAQPWEQFYARLAAIAGVTAPVVCDSPDVEVIAGEAHVVAVNHGRTVARLTLPGQGTPREIPAKDWTIMPGSGGVPLPPGAGDVP